MMLLFMSDDEKFSMSFFLMDFDAYNYTNTLSKAQEILHNLSRLYIHLHSPKNLKTKTHGSNVL
jgi:hypothetical protein